MPQLHQGADLPDEHERLTIRRSIGEENRDGTDESIAKISSRYTKRGS
jgi:hypothetical protein